MKILWYSVFLFSFFWLELTVGKDIWMKRIAVTVMLIFQRYYVEDHLIAAIFKVRSKQLQATLTPAF